MWEFEFIKFFQKNVYLKVGFGQFSQRTECLIPSLRPEFLSGCAEGHNRSGSNS